VRLSEIMTNAAVIDQSDDTLLEAARKMWKQQTGSLLVVDGEDLVGIITERDILKAVATGMQLDQARISEVMTKDIISVGPGTSLREAAKIMAD
jgi:CBS domain-containing protein